MPAIDSKTHSRSIVLWLWSAGIALAMAANVYQFMQTRRLTHDLSSTQENVAHQFADMRELESGALEQNLRRLDEMNKQFETITAAALEQARSEARRNRQELTKALEQRRSEVAKQMSDLKSDLKEETSARVSRVSSDLANTRAELARAVDDVNAKNGERPVASEEPPAAPAVVHGAAAEPAPAKKSFWSKLNPFKREKAKSNVASK